MQSLRYLAAAFGVMALASITNTACSTSGDIDSGTSESRLKQYANQTAYGVPAYGIDGYGIDGYGYFGANIAEDCAYGVPAAP